MEEQRPASLPRVFLRFASTSGRSSNYVGYTEVEAVRTESLATATSILPANSTLRVVGGATLDLNEVTQTVAGLADWGAAGGAVINDTSLPVTLTINPGEGSTSFSGVIDDDCSISAMSVEKNPATAPRCSQVQIPTRVQRRFSTESLP